MRERHSPGHVLKPGLNRTMYVDLCSLLLVQRYHVAETVGAAVQLGTPGRWQERTRGMPEMQRNGENHI